jgi:hypothetical protein
MTMQKKYLISLGLLSGILIASLLAFNTPHQKSDATCCKKEVKECAEKITPVETSMENLSLQFIALPASFN